MNRVDPLGLTPMCVKQGTCVGESIVRDYGGAGIYGAAGTYSYISVWQPSTEVAVVRYGDLGYIEDPGYDNSDLLRSGGSGQSTSGGGTGGTLSRIWQSLDDNLGITGPTKSWRDYCASLGMQAGAETCYEARSPLRVIHLEPPLQGSASYRYWSSRSTQEIIDSLAPGAKNPLTVTQDGAIMDGNSRVTVLMERGIDVNRLPVVEYTPWPMPELDMPPVE
jgi:hypothetical protein